MNSLFRRFCRGPLRVRLKILNKACVKEPGLNGPSVLQVQTSRFGLQLVLQVFHCDSDVERTASCGLGCVPLHPVLGAKDIINQIQSLDLILSFVCFLFSSERVDRVADSSGISFSAFSVSDSTIWL